MFESASIVSAVRSRPDPCVLPPGPEALRAKWTEVSERFLPFEAPGTPWRYSRHLTSEDPRQGWKIHLSATILNASDLLEGCGTFLTERGVAFKGPSTLDELRKLNSGIWYGYFQIGKFMTVYPGNACQFADICRELDLISSWTGRGPVVPFDRRLHPASNVFYRYGVFGDACRGSLSGMLVSPSGEPVDDDRAGPAMVPYWESDPFDENEIAHSPTEAYPSLFETRYKIYRSLSQRGKGGVYEAIDISGRLPRQCVIKEGRRNGEVSWSGTDGFDRIRKECRIISFLSRTCRVPSVINMFAAGDNLYLVLERLEGISLDRLLREERAEISLSERLTICREIVELVSKIHRAGIVWRDCKPSNFLIDRNGKLWAVDFEGSCPVDKFDAFAWSTPDYSPPEIRSGYYTAWQPSNLPEDLFALGCCLYLILEGHRPFPERDLSISPTMSHRVDLRIRSVILGLLDDNPAERPSAAEVEEVLTSSA